MNLEIGQLRERNARLREENSKLRVRLNQERQHVASEGMDGGHRELEVGLCKDLIREKEKQATILALHDELTRLNRQCAVYADALEEARGNFVEVKRLYGELNNLLDHFNGPKHP
ncbi:hypothetical protein C3747_200g50c [Trypanosoma cruzi]|uniref:Uncharacterized protein n=2 Tax=Trypanosoma cruzi TaxID=5693 RepID=Q4D4N7_TRYCC|nr:hypothetical protein, conserved [Trypanosoma cruzi]EAN87487.1 hypothetical protein, conserved [Trypanosoma cruzi]PWV01192.1 hypothetical protein C3747_200g50c [Trypanosoma cruzi]RNC40976.1 hypothetical protein TcCL_NonESM09484 [Trypanosoma cruzi]|eukprot:XP_809338.1 hypothetical protein [Trypanosoma cruzi strain CL Brener]